MSGSLKEKIQASVVKAMKARESQKVQALRNVTSAIKRVEVDERKELTDAEVEKIVVKLDKQLSESLEQAEKLGRTEAIEEAQFEKAILVEFLPKKLSDDELKAIVESVHAEIKDSLPEGGAAMGKMMQAVMAKVGSGAEGKAVQSAVREVLA